MTDQPLGVSEIRAYLLEVAEALPLTSPQHELVMVGGSLLAWHGMRFSTRDVDTVTRMDDEMKAAVHVVAAAHGLTPEWLNDHASLFLPQTLNVGDCEVLMSHPRLVVLGAPLGQVFLMKVHAALSRSRDLDDLEELWPSSGFTPESAVAAYWEAYPGALDDPHLITWIRDIAARATSEG